MKKTIEQLETELAAVEAKADALLSRFMLGTTNGMFGKPLSGAEKKKMQQYSEQSDALREEIRKTRKKA